MSARPIRFPVQAGYGAVGLFVFVFDARPWGALDGTVLLLFGFWLGDRIFERIATLDEIKADLRQRVDEGL